MKKKPQATGEHLEDIVPILAALSLTPHLRSLRFGATRCGTAIFDALTSMFGNRCGLRKIELHLSDDGASDIVSELPSEEVFASFGRALSHLVELQNLVERMRPPHASTGHASTHRLQGDTRGSERNQIWTICCCWRCCCYCCYARNAAINRPPSRDTDARNAAID